MKTMEEVEKKMAALAKAAAEKAVADRMSVTPPPAPAVATVTARPVVADKKAQREEMREQALAKCGLLLQREYVQKFGAGDRGLTEKARTEIIEKTNALVGTAGQGGSVFPPEYASEIIGVLHEVSVLKEAGAQQVTWSGGSLTYGKLNQGVTIGWTTEAGTPTPQNISTDDLQLVNKYLKGYATISNAALRAPGADLAAALARDVLLASGAEIDAKFLVGDGTNNTPTGVVEQLHVNQTEAITATPTVVKVRKDLAQTMKRVRAGKLHFAGASPAWIMPSLEFYALLAARDGAGNAFPELAAAQPTLFGHPVFVTDAISDQIIFGLMKHVLWGSSFGPEVGMGLINADLVAGTSTIYTHFVGDVAVRYDKALAVLTGTSAWATLS